MIDIYFNSTDFNKNRHNGLLRCLSAPCFLKAEMNGNAIFNMSFVGLTTVYSRRCISMERLTNMKTEDEKLKHNEWAKILTNYKPQNMLLKKNEVIEIKEQKSRKEESKQPLTRKTSLKQAGVSCIRKIVHFADAMGLDLVAVKCFPSEPETNDNFSQFKVTNIPEKANYHFMPTFQNPKFTQVFEARLESQKICLESAAVFEYSVHGTVKVIDMAFEKKIMVRVTYDEWKTFTDVDCAYVPNSYDGKTSRFSFVLFSPFQAKSIEFAIFYCVWGNQYWDNNKGQNYRFMQPYVDQQAPVPDLFLH